MDTMFRKSLADLVRGIRQNKKDEDAFINKAIAEIKEELRQVNKRAKMVAVQKLTYLHMLGYDVTWSAFNVIEVMSQPLFTAKRIGYLAASQTFDPTTDVLMLATNLFKKDIGSSNPYEAGLAINALSNVATPDLSRDLAPDIITLLSSSRPYVRKKGVLVLYKIFLQFPQALRPAFPRLKEKLEDPDMAVVSASVNVICELARKSPKNYLSLAPILFKILTVSTNNWMLIKIIKLFGSLAPLEPRLAKKLVEPLTNVMNSTTAMSLLYECIQTCTTGLTAHGSIIRLAITKLRLFIEDSDQNLKYLGLLALSKLMKIAPKAVQEHKDTVLKCLDDEDITIRLRALDLIVGMVNKRNLMDIVKKLIEKLEDADGSYKDDLVDKIIAICSQGNYQFITDFEWYITVLVELTHVQGTKHGVRISDQLMDVSIRVKVVREFAVSSMMNLLHDTRLTADNPKEGGICEVIYAAAWVIGEFIEFGSNFCAILDALLQPRIAALPGHIQAVNIQNALKVFTYIANHCPKTSTDPSGDSFESALNIMKTRLPVFTKSLDLETQERSCFVLETINLLEALSGSFVADLAQVFAEPLNPVAEKAQRKVPVPAGLFLDRQIHTPPSSESESEEEASSWGLGAFETAKTKAMDEQDALEERKRLQQRRANDPFYLGSSSKSLEDEECPSVETLTGDMIDTRRAPQIPLARSGKKKKIQVMATEEMPEGAGGSSDDDAPEDDLFAGIDLVTSLRPDEELKTTSYPLPSSGFNSSQQHSSSSAEDHKQRRRRKHREGREGGREKRKHRHRREDGGESKTPSRGGNDVGDLLGLGSTSPQVATPVSAPTSPSPSPVAVQQAPASPVATGGKPQFSVVLAGENQDISFSYELCVNAQQPDKVMTLLILRASRRPISGLQFAFHDSPSIRLVQPADLAPLIQLAPGATQNHRLLFQFKSFLQPQSLTGTLTYQAQGEVGRLNFEIVLSCASFVQPHSIDENQFNSVSGSLASATTKIRFPDPKSGLSIISEYLHVKVVKIADVAMLYGRSTQGHHVCVVVKNRNGGLSIDLRCSDSTLGDNLLKELKSALRKQK